MTSPRKVSIVAEWKRVRHITFEGTKSFFFWTLRTTFTLANIFNEKDGYCVCVKCDHMHDIYDEEVYKNGFKTLKEAMRWCEAQLG